jgi:hypothetical protein
MFLKKFVVITKGGCKNKWDSAVLAITEDDL